MSSEVGYGSPPVEHRFRAGRSGNPGGRPKGLARKVREVIGDDGDALVELWSAVLDGYIVSRHPKTGEQVYKEVSVADRIAVSRLLAERGWGKAPANVSAEDDADRFEKAQLDREAMEGLAQAFESELDKLAERRRQWNKEHAHSNGGAGDVGSDGRQAAKPQPA